MNVAAVSHFVDDAIAIGVAPDIPPMVCSWITAPSAATILIMPRDSPAARTRSSSSASVAVECLRSEVLASRCRRRGRDRRRDRDGGRRRSGSSRIARCVRRRRPTADEQQSRCDERDCPPRPHEDVRLSHRVDRTKLNDSSSGPAPASLHRCENGSRFNSAVGGVRLRFRADASLHGPTRRTGSIGRRRSRRARARCRRPVGSRRPIPHLLVRARLRIGVLSRRRAEQGSRRAGAPRVAR